MDTSTVIEILNKARGPYHPILLLNEKAEFLSTLPWKPLSVKSNDTVCITLTKHKTSALCYDKIWYPFEGFVPDEIRTAGLGAAELELALINFDSILMDPELAEANLSREEIERIITQPISEERQEKKSLLKDRKPIIDAAISFSMSLENYSSDPHHFIRYLRELIYRKTKNIYTPVYSTTKKYFNDYNEVSETKHQNVRLNLVLSLSNLEIVDENSLSWEQVIQFRQDKDAKKKYKRLIHWLDKEMIDKPQSYIEDEIYLKLDDYKTALKKHGVKTVLGTISDVLDGKFLIGTAAVSAPTFLSGYPALSALVTGSIVAGKIVVSGAQRWIEYKHTEPDKYREVAYIYEIEKKLGGDFNASS